MTLHKGDTVEYLADISSPPAQKGARGEQRIVGETIDTFAARYLLKGGQVKKVDNPKTERKTNVKQPPAIGEGNQGSALS